MTLEYVDVATGRERSGGTRIVTSSAVASPWSEAAKGLFLVAKLPAVVIPRGPISPEIASWLGVDNVPVVLHEDEPARTNWAAIVGLAARLAPGALVPVDPGERARAMGLIDLIAGEGGLGWTSRLAMIHASFASGGVRGFALPVAKFLAKRYGFTRDLTEGSLVERVRGQLATLRSELRGEYFGASALDIYAATFLTPLVEIDDTVCPQMIEPVRRAFASARELLAEHVPAELWAHRTRMFERHLPLPIRLA